MSEERSVFADVVYWERRYDEESKVEPYDWILDWKELEPFFTPLLAERRDATILHLGCGNSGLPEDMHDAGYKRHTCLDFSTQAISMMRERNRSARPELVWKVADCTDLSNLFLDDTFDLVIDKCTTDALLCHELQALTTVRHLKEAFRVTAAPGVFVCISMHDPPTMLPWFRQRAFDWTVRTHQLLDKDQPRPRPGKAPPPPSANYVYVCTKRCPAAPSLEKYWPLLAKRVEDRPDSDLSSEGEDTEEDG